MERELELELLSELLAMVEREPAGPPPRDFLVPVEHYTSPQFYQAEQLALFQGLPLVVGHTSELREAGDFLTHDATGIPLLVVRSPEGPARAFLNVCRHRGTKLVTERRGNARAFVCRYHAWSYELGGALLRVPRRDCFPSLSSGSTTRSRSGSRRT